MIYGREFYSIFDIAIELDKRYDSKHHFSDLFRFYKRGLPFYFRLNSVEKGVKIMTFDKVPSKEIHFDNNPTIECKYNPYNTDDLKIVLGGSIDGCFLNEEIWKFHEDRELTYIRFPKGVFFINNEVFCIEGTEYTDFDRPSSRYDPIKNNFRAPKEVTYINSIDVCVLNIFINTKEFEDFFSTNQSENKEQSIEIKNSKPDFEKARKPHSDRKDFLLDTMDIFWDDGNFSLPRYYEELKRWITNNHIKIRGYLVEPNDDGLTVEEVYETDADYKRTFEKLLKKLK